MYIPITTAALASLTAAMILLQVFWLRIPSRLRSFLIRASIAIIVLHALFVVTKWTTTSDRLNVVINWLAIAGYELLVLLFARLSPRWLTIPSAAILLIPLFAASIVFPLAHLFDPSSNRTTLIADHLFYEIEPWTNTGGGNAGINILIYYYPPIVPFLRHKLQGIPFNDHECNANAAFAIPGPNANTILGRCPHWPTEPSGSIDKLVTIH
jgi:hypothetical protein